MLAFMRVASSFSFLAWEVMYKCILTVFISYQDLVNQNELMVLSDSYQEVERWIYICFWYLIFAVQFLCVVLGLITCIFMAKYARLYVDLFNGVLYIFLLHMMIPCFVSFFYMLATRRKYEFGRFHSYQEIPLTIVYVAFVAMIIYYKLESALVLFYE